MPVFQYIRILCFGTTLGFGWGLGGLQTPLALLALALTAGIKQPCRRPGASLGRSGQRAATTTENQREGGRLFWGGTQISSKSGTSASIQTLKHGIPKSPHPTCMESPGSGTRELHSEDRAAASESEAGAGPRDPRGRVSGNPDPRPALRGPASPASVPLREPPDVPRARSALGAAGGKVTTSLFTRRLGAWPAPCSLADGAPGSAACSSSSTSHGQVLTDFRRSQMTWFPL